MGELMNESNTEDLSNRVDGEALTHEEHPELHHYTDKFGLAGILQSNELWATHYKHLNDSSEFIQLNEILCPSLEERLAQLIEELFRNKESEMLQRAVEKHVREKIAKKQAQAILDVFYNVTFQGGKRPFPFADPFITSFCSHSADEEYEKQNGLLSQWSRYGGESGFAIVFDTLMLSPLLKREASSHNYAFVTTLDVVYNSSRR